MTQTQRICSLVGGLLGITLPLAVQLLPAQPRSAQPLSEKASVPTAKAQKPNFIFVLADDMGYADLGCYGGTGAKTPNLDRLAQEGIRFSQFYVSSPICSPSRTAFTTGQYPARWGITSYISDRAANRRRGMAQWLDVSAPTLARSLTQVGYRTGHFGKWHLGGGRDVGEAPLPTEYGFSQSLTQFEGLGDRVLPLMSANGNQPERKLALGAASEKLGRGKVRWVQRSQVTKTFVDGALQFIRQSEQARQPFYLNLWPDDVHSPFDPPAKLRGDGSKKALYEGVLTNMDEQLAPLFEAIRSNPKLRDNTVIIFASDNGPEAGAGSAGEFQSGKGNLYEGGIRAPLIVWAPKAISENKRGTINDTAVLSAVDLMPSLLGLAGAHELTPKGDGYDVGATLTGKTATGRTQPLFWKRPPGGNNRRQNAVPDLAVREGKWKLLTAENGGRAQLYDLSADAGERENVASLHPQVTRRLKQLVLDWNQTLPRTQEKAESRFVLQNGQHLDPGDAPEIAAKEISVQATFDRKSANGAAGSGVLVAHGGVANGYVLFVEPKGNLVFLVRRNKQAYTVQTPLSGDGPHQALAGLKRDGTLSLSLNGKPAVQSKGASLFEKNPVDGLDVGSDQAGLVGPYQNANPFTGMIQSVMVELSDIP